MGATASRFGTEAEDEEEFERQSQEKERRARPTQSSQSTSRSQGLNGRGVVVLLLRRPFWCPSRSGCDCSCSSGHCGEEVARSAFSSAQLGSLSSTPGNIIASSPCQCCRDTGLSSYLQRVLLQRLKEHPRMSCRILQPSQNTGESPGSGCSKNDCIILAVQARPGCIFEMAQEQGIPKQTLRGRWLPFRKDVHHQYVNGDNPLACFSAAECICLVRRELYNMRLAGDAPFASFKASRVLDLCHVTHAVEVDDIFPLHESRELSLLWAQWRSSARSQPLDKVVWYFGKPVGYYFAFLATYSKCLMIPAILGVLYFFCADVAPFLSIASRFSSPISIGDLESTMNYCGAVFTAIIALFSFFFIENWKRTLTMYRFQWGAWNEITQSVERVDLSDWPGSTATYRLLHSVTGETNESQMALFSELRWLHKRKGKTSLAQAAMSTFAEHARGGVHIDPRPSPSGVLFFDGAYWRHFSVFIAVLIIIASSGTTVVIVLELQRFVRSAVKSRVVAILPTVAYLALAHLLKSFYTRAASFLTSLEGHWSPARFHASFIKKNALFQLFNFLGFYIYLAFVVRSMVELKLQLWIFFVFKQVWQNILEFIIPMSHRRLSTHIPTEEGMKSHHSLTVRAISENNLAPYDVSGEYLELALQFSLTAMFSAVFPMAPLLCLINNAQELRADAYKACRLSRRPFPSDGSDVSAWIAVYEALSVIGTMTSIFLLGMMQNWSLASILFFEHLLLFMKSYITQSVSCIPDTIAVLLTDGDHAPLCDFRSSIDEIGTSGIAVHEMPGVALQRTTQEIDAMKQLLERKNLFDPTALSTVSLRPPDEPRSVMSSKRQMNLPALLSMEGEWKLIPEVSDPLDALLDYFEMSWIKRWALKKSCPTVTIEFDIVTDNSIQSAHLRSMRIETRAALMKTRQEVRLDESEVEHFDDDSGLWKSCGRCAGDSIVIDRQHLTKRVQLVETRRIIRSVPMARAASVSEKGGSSPQRSNVLLHHFQLIVPGGERHLERFFERVNPVTSSNPLELTAEEPRGPTQATVAPVHSTSSAAPDATPGEDKVPIKLGDDSPVAVASGLSEDDTRMMGSVTEKARGACEKLKRVMKSNDWVSAGSKNGAILWRLDIPGEPMVGKGVVEFDADVPYDKVYDFVWDPDTKRLYDTSVEISLSLRLFPNGAGVMYQAIKGQYGVPGRDFLVAAWKEAIADGHLIAFTSCDWPEDSRMSKKHVRGDCLLGGFQLRRMDTGKTQLSYVNQADLKGNIPEWIVTSAKLDQLKTVGTLKKKLLERL